MEIEIYRIYFIFLNKNRIFLEQSNICSFSIPSFKHSSNKHLFPIQSRKKSNPKNEKTVKTQVKLLHVNKKPPARKRILFKNRFLTLLLERKNFTP